MQFVRLATSREDRLAHIVLYIARQAMIGVVIDVSR